MNHESFKNLVDKRAYFWGNTIKKCFIFKIQTKLNIIEWIMAEMATFTEHNCLFPSSPLFFWRKIQNNWRFLGTLGTCFENVCRQVLGVAIASKKSESVPLIS